VSQHRLGKCWQALPLFKRNLLGDTHQLVPAGTHGKQISGCLATFRHQCTMISEMTMHTHQTAPTQYVEAGGVHFAYRRFGKADNGLPLVFNQHFRGTMDYWDPVITDGLARTREVILFNNAGVSSSSGEVPTRSRRWARMQSPSLRH
jgi:hypothetical protein